MPKRVSLPSMLPPGCPAGRRQYLYHEQWRIKRDKSKHDRVLTVAARLPRRRGGEEIRGSDGGGIASLLRQSAERQTCDEQDGHYPEQDPALPGPPDHAPGRVGQSGVQSGDLQHL